MHLPSSLATRTALCACIATMAAAPAYSAIYSPEYDPTYGPDFPNLGWRARAQLFVPDLCLSTVNFGRVRFDHGTGNALIGAGLGGIGGSTIGDCNAIAFGNVEVELYNINAPETIIEYFLIETNEENYTYRNSSLGELYGPDSLDPAIINMLSYVDIYGGELDGFGVTNSSLMFSEDLLTQQATGALQQPGEQKVFTINLTLANLVTPIPEGEFERGILRSDFSLSSVFGGVNGGVLKQVEIDDSGSTVVGRSGQAAVTGSVTDGGDGLGPTPTAPTVNPTQAVPEPRSLALVLTALLGLFATRVLRRGRG